MNTGTSESYIPGDIFVVDDVILSMKSEPDYPDHQTLDLLGWSGGRCQVLRGARLQVTGQDFTGNIIVRHFDSASRARPPLCPNGVDLAVDPLRDPTLGSLERSFVSESPMRLFEIQVVQLYKGRGEYTPGDARVSPKPKASVWLTPPILNRTQPEISKGACLMTGIGRVMGVIDDFRGGKMALVEVEGRPFQGKGSGDEDCPAGFHGLANVNQLVPVVFAH